MATSSAKLHADLEQRVDGTVLTEGDAGYDEARAIWNARFDRRPALIVRCEDTADVSAALRFARSHSLPVSVKGGGHHYSGSTVADGALLIDLGPMRSITVDTGARRAHVGAGATWGELDAATQEHGLATSGGTVSTVGVAGLTLGGGEGWLSRTHGLACDNLTGAEVVTASGEIVRASETENADLLWALRGGGGNCGVVTAFEYRLHEVGPEVVAGQLFYPADRAPELLRRYRDVFRDAPDELGCTPFLLRVPPVDAFPSEWHGALALAYILAWVGPPDEAERHFARFRGAGDAFFEHVARVPYVDLQRSFDEGLGGGGRWYTRAHYFDELTDEAIDDLVAHLDPFPGASTVVYFSPSGGAVGRVAPDATAFPHRTSAHGLHILAGWTDPSLDGSIMAWTRDLHEVMAPHANGGVYVNLLAEDEAGRVPSAYGHNYARLADLKRTWDPDNVFRGNHNVPPAR